MGFELASASLQTSWSCVLEYLQRNIAFTALQYLGFLLNNLGWPQAKAVHVLPCCTARIQSIILFLKASDSVVLDGYVLMR